MKKVTAAIVIIDKYGNILGCHATGKPKGMGYDFPKGLVEEGESDKDADDSGEKAEYASPYRQTPCASAAPANTVHVRTTGYFHTRQV